MVAAADDRPPRPVTHMHARRVGDDVSCAHAHGLTHHQMRPLSFLRLRNNTSLGKTPIVPAPPPPGNTPLSSPAPRVTPSPWWTRNLRPPLRSAASARAMSAVSEMKKKRGSARRGCQLFDRPTVWGRAARGRPHCMPSALHWLGGPLDRARAERVESAVQAPPTLVARSKERQRKKRRRALLLSLDLIDLITLLLSPPKKARPWP